MPVVEDAAVKYAEGLATALVGKLGLLLVQEYQLVSGVRDEVVLLMDDAAMMNALLRMFSEADQDVVDHFVREWMKQVHNLAYDGEDCIDLFMRHISLVPKGTNCLGRAWYKIVKLRLRRSLAGDIKALRARAIAISERRARYGVYGQALEPSVAFGSRVPMSSTPPLLGGANNNPDQFVGMEAHIQTLSGVVNGGDETHTVCSIVGVGGVGKSTLAVGVFGRLKDDFDCMAVVPVSQQYNLAGLMEGIHEAFGYAVNTETTFAQHLEHRRYLIVLDDVWTTSAWNEISAKLPENDKRNRIILTTRIENVATTCSQDGGHVHHANLLDDEASKTLFVRRVFGQPIHNVVAADNVGQPILDAPAAHQNNGQPILDVPAAAQNVGQPMLDAPAPAQNDGQPILDAPAAPQNVGQPILGCPEELEEKMDIILKKCGGLPLAIVCIANVLASYNSPASIEMWRRVCNSVGSQLETNSALEGMMRIIALSYNHLPHPLKACAMLLSIFPQGYHIPMWRLVRRWITEGLIPEKRGLTLLDVAEAYYEELLSRNIIQIVVLPDGKVSEGHCRVHDIMYEVIVSKSLEENFVSFEGSTNKWISYDPVRRLCIHGDVGYVADGRSMKHVRSLTTFGAKENHGVGKLLDGLAKFTLLRVLDLEDCKDLKNKHMKQVCMLFLLRFLNLNGTNITELPSEISNLQHLQSLMLYDALLEGVPESVSNLEKLEYLSFQNRNDVDATHIRLRLPLGLRQMKALQHLTRLEIGINDVQLANEIGDLVQLRELGVIVKMGYSREVQGALQSSVVNLRFLRKKNIVYEGNPANEAPEDQAAQGQPDQDVDNEEDEAL